MKPCLNQRADHPKYIPNRWSTTHPRMQRIIIPYTLKTVPLPRKWDRVDVKDWLMSSENVCRHELLMVNRVVVPGIKYVKNFYIQLKKTKSTKLYGERRDNDK